MFFEDVLGLRFCVFLLVGLDYDLYSLCYLSYLSYRGMSRFTNKTQVNMDSSFGVFPFLSFVSLFICSYLAHLGLS